MNYFTSVLIAFDQLVNALLGGWPDETLSSRAWRWHSSGVRSWPCKLIDKLFFWDYDYAQVSFEPVLDIHDKRKRNHCELSFVSERQDRHQPPELRVSHE